MAGIEVVGALVVVVVVVLDSVASLASVVLDGSVAGISGPSVDAGAAGSVVVAGSSSSGGGISWQRTWLISNSSHTSTTKILKLEDCILWYFVALNLLKFVH